MSKTAVIVGSTGLVGSHLTSLLANAPFIFKIVSITRRPVRYDSKKIVNVVLEYEQLANYSHYFKGDFLFSCLGTTRKQAGSIEAQRKVDLEYQLTAAKIACDNNVGHYFLVSSSGANANSNNAYLAMKGELEQSIKKLPFKSITIIQPSLLLGNRNQSRLAEGIGGLLLPTLCKLPGLHRFRPIHAKLVAKKMLELSESTTFGIHTVTLDQVFPDS